MVSRPAVALAGSGAELINPHPSLPVPPRAMTKDSDSGAVLRMVS